MTAPKGTLRELRLAKRALAACRTHLSRARTGLRDSADAEALAILVTAHELIQRIGRLGKKRAELRRAA